MRVGPMGTYRTIEQKQHSLCKAAVAGDKFLKQEIKKAAVAGDEFMKQEMK